MDSKTTTNRERRFLSLRLLIAVGGLHRRPSILLEIVCALVLFGFAGTAPAADRSAIVDGYKVVHVYPHDTSAFTQGLIYLDGFLYEGTGLNGKSQIRMVDLKSGKVLQHYDLPKQYFGEDLLTGEAPWWS